MKKWFTGIVPPRDIYETITGIQHQFGDNRLEPHITITSPATLSDERQWLHSIEYVCKQCNTFPISLSRTGQFGDRVLYIDVSSELLADFHRRIEQAAKIFEQARSVSPEHSGYSPHLTLARKWCGFTPQHFEEIKLLTEEYLGRTPITFTADFLRIYHKPAAGGRYELYKDVPLGGHT